MRSSTDSMSSPAAYSKIQQTNPTALITTCDQGASFNSCGFGSVGAPPVGGGGGSDVGGVGSEVGVVTTRSLPDLQEGRPV